MKTLLGIEPEPCPKHGDARLGVLTGLCMACEEEIDARLYQRFIDAVITQFKKKESND